MRRAAPDWRKRRDARRVNRCDRKRRYRSRERAATAARKLNGAGASPHWRMVAYPCRDCGAWHVGRIGDRA